jgi:CHAT domain-containing protein
LYISREKTELLPLAGDGVTQRRRAIDLATSIVVDERLAKIDEDAALLSQLLLGALAGNPVPSHLLIVTAEPFNGLPWPLLHWPGSAAPLVETTSVSLAAPGAGTLHSNNNAIGFHVIPGASPDESALPALAATGGELSIIVDERRQHGWRVAAADDATRASVLAALADPGGWIHIAAHGTSNTEYLGRSGVWLGAAHLNEMPDLLSWMDIVEHGIRADVVVLNACALGSSPATSLSASTGFAETTLRAGAHDVVAALWPINDTAASLWASSFYAHLPAQPATADIADAVRAAMLRLRDTRAFRHPRYWASLVHLARVELPAASGAHGRQ